jgi:hypothetical protein
MTIDSRPGTLVRRKRHSLFRRALRRDFQILYQRYLKGCGAPFFTDISGPPAPMKYAEFEDYCTGEAKLWVMGCGNILEWFLLLCDLQPGLELANVDFFFFQNYPEPGSAEAAYFGRALASAANETRVTRLQLAALPFESGKLALAGEAGFHQEGILRKHFFHRGQFWDLQLLARMEPSRHALD